MPRVAPEGEGENEQLRAPTVTHELRKDGEWYFVTLDYFDYDRRQSLRRQTIILTFQRPNNGSVLEFGSLVYKGIKKSSDKKAFPEGSDELRNLKARAEEAIATFETDTARRSFP